MTEQATIEVDTYYPHPPAKVWRALTEPELIAQWLMPNDFRLEVGHRYTMESKPIPGTGYSGKTSAEVLGFEIEKVLRVSWTDAAAANPVDWTITWTLQPEGRGTRLFLLHEGFDLEDPLQQQGFTIMGGGWRTGVPTGLGKVLDAL